ncbi:hypothetical protein LEP1GSC005_1344 [Leptospira santarosai str. ST188]|uniref:hypothetical protein n=1 Tax=Leptospira santarosai TaxID=28183 RepID=UPI0002BB60C9|nr:hypothetical protein [Leptospira santarosai]EMF91185.1 hypothetical protein LEP1GSC005_1344 [Leptospira santarosai str. ST188]
MKDLVAAFLERFKHPILYSVLTSLAIWNFDFIYRLAIAPFHIQEMNPDSILKNFADELSLNRCDRVWFPMIKGFLIGAFLPSIVDIVYSTLVSYAMSLKEMGVHWGERVAWRNQIRDSREISYVLGQILENSENFQKQGKLSSDAKVYIFRSKPYIERYRVVKINTFERVIDYSSKIEGSLGIVYDILPNNLALVVMSGSITDTNFLNNFKNIEKSVRYLKITQDGILTPIPIDDEQKSKENAIAIIERHKQSQSIIEIKLLNPSREMAIYSSIKFRLFGES